MKTNNKYVLADQSLILDLINQLFDIEKKSNKKSELKLLERNINKIRGIIDNMFIDEYTTDQIGYSYYNPIGEHYNETRLDCEANIAGIGIDNLHIVEVIKPIIYQHRISKTVNQKKIIQKAIVIVESK